MVYKYLSQCSKYIFQFSHKLNIKKKYFVPGKYLLFSLTLARLISALNLKTFVVVVFIHFNDLFHEVCI